MEREGKRQICSAQRKGNVKGRGGRGVRGTKVRGGKGDECG